MEQATLTLTQMHLGAELVWEPKVGTVEHDRFVDAYIPGPHTLQTKRATMSLDFFSTVEATTMPFPFTRTYHASVPMQTSPISLKSFDSFSSVASSPAPGQKVAGTKRSHDDASAPNKRLPGFSIMTRDGVDITENQSRGPKTKEQREHAAKMRKLGACPSCKRRKQKCEPSHHRPFGASGSAVATPMSLSMSARSSIPSLAGPSPSLGSRASISPQSSLESAFTPSPNLMMPVGVAKQHQPWQDILQSADLLDDDFMIQNPQFDNFTFSQDMLSQNAAAGNWDFPAPPIGQDFDLFSHDNTLDFDANLYVNTPSPLLQSWGLSPTSLQQPPQAFQQSMDSQSPFAYDVNGQYLGNVDGSAGEYGVAVDFGDTGDTGAYGGLASDRNGDARSTPREGPEMVRFVKMSSCLTKKQHYIIQTTEVSSPQSTDGEFASIAGSPESPLQASIQSSSHHPVMDGGSHGHDREDASRHQQDSRQPSVEPSSPWSSFLDYSGGEVLRRTWATGHQNSLQPGSTNDLHDQQLQTTVNYKDGVNAPAQQSLSVHDRSSRQSSVSPLHKIADSSESVQPPQAGVPSPTLLDTAPTWSPSSGAKDTAPTWHVQSVAGASTTTHVSLRKAFKAHKSTRPTQQSSVALSAPISSGVCRTTTTSGFTSSVEVGATNSPHICVSVHVSDTKVSGTRTIVNGGRANKVDRETLNEHTAAKTHSLSTSKFVTSDTQSVVATVRKLATTYGLVVSTDTKKPVSMFSGVVQTVSSLVNAFRIGFNLGARQGTMGAKSMGRGPGRDLEVTMSGLRLC